ncbi:hypothetical protein BD770DRAFT_449666 [Pilaira anomala]|nr:hypothetical protein BD770DRAFT_449666 [Pilaira anomala]
MNHQYGPITFIEANESGNMNFDKSKDNFFIYLQASNLFPNVDFTSLPDPAKYLNEEYGINFYTYYQDKTPLQQIDLEELNDCRKNLENYIQIIQSKAILFVGSQLVRKHFGIYQNQGFFKEKTYPYTPHTSRYYVLPNTRKANRREQQTTFTRAFQTLVDELREHDIHL